MQKAVFEFPERINEFVVDDTLFARAYDTISDQHRALMKTGIARLFEWYGPARQTACRTAASWRGGFDSVDQSAPADYAVVVFDDTLQSPSRLLAAVVPALACGVKNILAIRQGDGEWPEAMLTGLELAGQEMVAAMTPEQAKELLLELDASGARGVVLGVELGRGVFRSLRFPSPRVEFKCLESEPDVAVWVEEAQLPDLDGLAFMHPDLAFSVHGFEMALPSDGFSRGGDDFHDFLDAIREVAYVPASRVDDVLDRARLVLGPGQEGCWVWPQLRPELFQFHSTAWTIGA